MRGLVASGAAVLALLASAGAVTAEPDEAVDPEALGPALASAFEETTAIADAEILSERSDGGYRIGLVLGPARVVRARTPGGSFIEGSPPDPAHTFVGVVVREERTKRFLPAARVTVDIRYEGGGDLDLPELVGRYPIYGASLDIPREQVLSVSVTVGPPAYNRHAEMLTTFVGEGHAKFLVEQKQDGHLAVIDPVRPAPVAADWTLGSDLQKAVGEAAGLKRVGDFIVGFITEGPEPIWLWKGEGNPPEHCKVADGDTHHLETIVIHEPSGLMITGASVTQRFSSPSEKREFALRPLLAEFYHYGLTTEVPAGDWDVTVQVDFPRNVAAWGRGMIASPERRLLAGFSFSPKVSGPGSIEDEARGFADLLGAAARKYGGGERDSGTEEVRQAFSGFGNSRLEARLESDDPKVHRSIETDWISLIGWMDAGAHPSKVGLAAKKLGERLRAAAVTFETSTKAAGGGVAPPGRAFGSSALFVVLLFAGVAGATWWVVFARSRSKGEHS